MVKLNNPTPGAILLAVLLFIWLMLCVTRMVDLMIKSWSAVGQSQGGMYSLTQSLNILSDALITGTTLVIFRIFFKQNVIDES